LVAAGARVARALADAAAAAVDAGLVAVLDPVGAARLRLGDAEELDAPPGARDAEGDQRREERAGQGASRAQNDPPSKRPPSRVPISGAARTSIFWSAGPRVAISVIRPTANTPPPAARVMVETVPKFSALRRCTVPSSLQALLCLQSWAASLFLIRVSAP